VTSAQQRSGTPQPVAEIPIKNEECRVISKAQVNHSLSLSGHPRPADWIVIDGRSPGSRMSDNHLPSRAVSAQWHGPKTLGDDQQAGRSGMTGNPLTVAGAATV